MIYAVLQNRQEEESGLYSSRNFTTVVFNGEHIDCERMAHCIELIDDNLRQRCEYELSCIENELDLLKKQSDSILSKIKMLPKILMLRARMSRLKELQIDSAEERKIQYLNAFASLGFERCHVRDYADGTLVQDFQLDIDSETLRNKLIELERRYKELQRKYISGLNSKYGIESSKVVQSEAE